MDVSAVKSYEKRNPLQTVINSTLIGAAVGYGAKYAIPVQEREKKNIAYRAIANSARKNENEKNDRYFSFNGRSLVYRVSARNGGYRR